MEQMNTQDQERKEAMEGIKNEREELLKVLGKVLGTDGVAPLKEILLDIEARAAANAIQKSASGSFIVELENDEDHIGASVKVNGTSAGLIYAAYALLEEACANTEKDIKLMLRVIELFYNSRHADDNEEKEEEE